MILEQFWLTDAQFSKIAPHLPTDTRGKARVDDRRVISGIVHVLGSGGRWIDAPPETVRKKRFTIAMSAGRPRASGSTCFTRSLKSAAPPAEVLIDSSAVKAHRSASGGEGGRKIRPSADHAADARPKSTR